MRILIAAAAAFEIEPFVNRLAEKGEGGKHEFHICLTGIGMMHAAHALTRDIMSFHPEMAVQAGIAGAFNQSLRPGDVVLVQADCQGDLGIDDRGCYQDIFETGLIAADAFPYRQNGILINPLSEISFGAELPKVKGLTVNTVSGSDTLIGRRNDKYRCDIESMEGAAFHYVCLKEGVPFVQIRAISNYVEPRDKSKWRIREAVDNLNDCLIKALL